MNQEGPPPLYLLCWWAQKMKPMNSNPMFCAGQRTVQHSPPWVLDPTHLGSVSERGGCPYQVTHRQGVLSEQTLLVSDVRRTTARVGRFPCLPGRPHPSFRPLSFADSFSIISIFACSGSKRDAGNCIMNNLKKGWNRLHLPF